MARLPLPITACNCRFCHRGLCTRPGGAEMARTYMFPPQIGGTYTECAGQEDCADREIAPDPVKRTPKKATGRWHFGLARRDNRSPEPLGDTKLLEYWSWSEGDGLDAVTHHVRAIAWTGDSIPEMLNGTLEEVSPGEMANILARRRHKRAFHHVSEWGISGRDAARAGCEIYHTNGDWAISATPALIKLLEEASR